MQRIVLLARECERCPHLGIEPLAEQRLACCSIKASGDPHAAGSITFCIKKGGGTMQRIVLLARNAVASQQLRLVLDSSTSNRCEVSQSVTVYFD